MADKAISELVAATLIGPTDLFVMEQGGTAKKATGQLFENWLLSFADGHGGIQSLVKTSSTGTDPVIDTYTITYADQTTSTFSVTNGIKGDKGDQTYVWIKYASRYPQADSDMSDSPDDWVGLYSGTSSTAPTHYTDYTWYEWKGEVGNPAILGSQSVSYQASQNGTTVPTGTWVDTPPFVTPGTYLWTRVVLTFNSGDPVTYYTVSRYGIDGQGSAGTSIPLPDSTSGAVGTSMSFSREDHQHPLPIASDIVLQNGHTVEADISGLQMYEPIFVTGTISSTQLYLTDSRITSDMRVIESSFGTPSNVASNLVCTTSEGRITFAGTLSGATTISLILIKAN